MSYLLANKRRAMRRLNNFADDPGSIRGLIGKLGGDSVVTGFWDCRLGITAAAGLVTSWADVRGASAAVGAMTAAGTQRPTQNADASLTFDAVANRLQTNSAGLAAITSSCWAVLVTRGTSTVARRELELSIDTTTTILDLEFVTAANYQARGANIAATPISAAATASPRVFHGRRTSTVDVAARVGNAAEVATAQVTGDQTCTLLTVGCSRSATLFSGMQNLRAVIIGAGVYTAAQVALINAWAVAAHGAVLTN